MDNYKIVKSTTVWGLQFEVNELISEGWEPNGALVVENGEYIQSMIKKPEPEPVLVEETEEVEEPTDNVEL